MDRVGAGDGRVVSEFSSTSLFTQLLSSEPGDWLVKLVRFSAELSPKKFWLGPRSQEVGGEKGRLYTVIIRMTPALKWAAMRTILMFQ